MSEQSLSEILDQIECLKCGKMKLASEFYWRSPYRMSRPCKECAASYMKQRKTDPVIHARYVQCSREHYAINKPLYRIKCQKRLASRYRPKREPAREKAGAKLRAAVRRGRISKPTHCQHCLSLTPTRSLHGHHRDYGKPLEVVWLCTACHGKEHRRYAN